MSTLRKIGRRDRQETQTLRKIKMRAHLNADTLFALIRKDLQRVPDHRAANASIPLDDVLMSVFAMFPLKDSSLLAFDDRRIEEPESLHGVFGVGVILSDTQMRTTLDEVVPVHIRRPFRSIFHQLQRGKVLPKMTCLARSTRRLNAARSRNWCCPMTKRRTKCTVFTSSTT